MAVFLIGVETGDVACSDFSRSSRYDTDAAMVNLVGSDFDISYLISQTENVPTRWWYVLFMESRLRQPYGDVKVAVLSNGIAMERCLHEDSFTTDNLYTAITTVNILQPPSLGSPCSTSVDASSSFKFFVVLQHPFQRR
ncbi:hypothetical protein PIB30_060178 [Stylosanthes scabra]|uniref:Uncharacterized protein n=1 Tax=Stylosanthes scabra TaxID=79078 RepID=A0ABU6SKH1_9FABA|nr:hypothetical protein [Stylosanthes scabra]